jgi:DNA repair protein SbcC/Rad50
MSLRIAHLADVHAKPEAFDLVRQSFEAIIDEHARSPFDLIAIAGDFWHGAIMDTARAQFAAFLELVRRLADCAPVVFIYGTPSHDTEGSLEVFEQIRARYPIVILRPGVAYYLNRAGYGAAIVPADQHGPPAASITEALLFGIPEPNKKWLLAGAEATGKDDSDLAVRDAMRRLLLGLGGLRQQHSDLPCLVLYHGQVAGAKSATGFGVETGSGISVTQDELGQIGADYYALGDIHEPQRIPGLPAYYPGSVYPGNWGETHKAGCNVVAIEEFPGTKDPFNGDRPGFFQATVSRLDFPHPQRVKFSRTWPSWIVDQAEFEGRLAWVEITCTAEEAAGIHPENQLESMLDWGALEGSRVTLNILPTETVRAGEITEKKRLRDKIGVWAEASSLTAPESALKRADELEYENTEHGAGQGAHIRIDRLRLRGAIGIYKKSKKDEIDLDLAALGEGVLALVGANGYGKTTILENLHPWPQMLTRDGTLKSHFRLRDSARELWFSDERTGWRYRALINIRADIESGAAEYFLFRDQGDGRGELPLDNVNGRKEPYEQAIGELFGSLEMYLQTAFVTQRPSKYAPDLGQATQGQRKTLFGELAGIDYLDRYRVAAKTRADALDADIRGKDERIAAAAGVDEEIQQLTTERGEAEAKEKAALADAERAEAEGRTLAAEREALALRVAEVERKAARRAQIARELEEVARAIAAIEEEVEGFALAAEGRAAAARELEKIKALEARRAGLLAEKAKFDEADRALMLAHQRRLDELRAERAQAQRDLDTKRQALSGAERAAAVARAKVGAEPSDKCPTCGQDLPEGLYDPLLLAFHQAENEAERLEAAAAAAYEAVGTAEHALAAIVDPPAPAATPFSGATGLAEIERALEWTDKDGTEAKLKAGETATVRIEGARRRQDDARQRAARLQEERSGLGEGEMNERPLLEDKDRELGLARDRLTAARATAAAARATAQAKMQALSGAQERKRGRDEAKAARDAAATERDDWRFLERATGPDGIQALELDALAPSIAAVANKLLGEAYGSRYMIEFRTTRIAGTGKKTKQVEDFEIYILDTETGDEQTIDSLSGGEAVWIRKALYDAFAIIRARNTDRRFMTVFLDEADGALDPEARMLYLRMVEGARRESGGFQTILVTHSRELQAMVERTIDVTTLGPREKKSEGGIAA